MRLLDRYLAREMVWPFLVGVGAFTAILMGTSALFQLAKMAAMGVPLGTVVQLFFLGLPAFVVLTFPMAMLFSSLMAFGRLSGDSEVVALFASGISLYRMLVPVAVLALGVAALTWEFNEAVVPWSSRSAAALRESAGQAQAQTRIVLPQFRGNQLVWLVVAGEYDPARRMMKNVLFQQFGSGGAPVFDVSAPEARYIPEVGKWQFYNCTVRQILPDGSTHYSRFGHAEYDIGQRPEDIQKSKVRAEQMTYAELQRYIQDQRRQGLRGSPVAENEVELQRKAALPFTSFVFAAVGAPLGVRPGRRGSGLGLGLGFSVLIIFAFYVLTSYLSVMGGQGLLDPTLAAWLPNLITLALGLVLLARAPK